ncbi:YhgE/Pip domain-containing protein [Bacillus niameyensis]|uniref:YhgE/Pip domain-containing protein n=1 Tax=Bacillus niameyensis TaxID=1522308 RepID=UPI000784975C|nr:YhgE/Pip domain-containing protein [Bacillus niameyensis]
MRKIIDIYTTDIKKIVTNWAAMVIIGGLAVLPSLYAWFNIYAMWDPYSRTGDLPVGIVNEDQGAVIRDKEIDVGKELVESLKDNKSMDWHFTDRTDAMDKVEFGDYYAVVIIPEDFSEQLATVVSDHPTKAQIEYYVNEKLNSVSPKITEKGATTIVDQISSKFISTVNGVIFDLFNELGIELEQNLPDIEKFENYVFMLEKDLPEINRMLNETMNDADSAENVLNKANGMLPKAKQYTNDGLSTINKTTDYLDTAESRLKEMAPQIEKDLQRAQTVTKNISDFLNEVQNTNIDLSQDNTVQKDLEGQINSAIQNLDTIEKSLKQLQEINAERPDQENQGVTNDQIDLAIQQTAELKAALQQMQGDADQLNKFLQNHNKDFDKILDRLHNTAEDTSVKLDDFVKEYKDNIEPTVLNEVAKAKKTLSGAKGILVEIQSTLPEVERLISNTQKNLQEGKGKLDYASGQFPYVNTKVRELADKIRKVQGEADLNEIIQLLQNDPSAERSFFEEPVQLNENKLFPIKNYGTGMTPFYTVLAIWVGALLLISLLAVDVHNDGLYTGRQIYFGRFMTFLTIGFVQTLIVTSGDLFLLNVEAEHPIWLIIFALLISFVFILIVYSLVSVFGNVGKALAIIMLVLQISGSGGTYPVVLLPKFFQIISPFLPFTYGVDLMREAVGGIVLERTLRDVAILCLFGIIALIFGAFLKEPINKMTKKFLEKSKESGLVH